MYVWVYVFQSVCVCVSAKWWSQLATRRINRTSTLRFHTNITHFIVLAFLPTHPSPPHLCNYNGHTLCMNALLHRLSANAAVAKWHSAKQAFAMNATCLRDTHTHTHLHMTAIPICLCVGKHLQMLIFSQTNVVGELVLVCMCVCVSAVYALFVCFYVHLSLHSHFIYYAN